MVPTRSPVFSAIACLLGERAPLLGGGTGNLEQEYHPGNAASAAAIGPRRGCDVVGHQHRLDIDPLHCRQLRGHIEVHHVATVEIQDASACVHIPRCRQDLLRIGGCEHIAHGTPVEQPLPDVPDEHRQMSRAATGDDRHFRRLWPIRPDDHAPERPGEAEGPRIGQDQTVEYFIDKFTGLIHDLFHIGFPLDSGMDPSRLSAHGRGEWGGESVVAYRATMRSAVRLCRQVRGG